METTLPELQESQDLSPSVIIPILLVDVLILFFFGRKYRWVPLLLIFALAPFQHDMSFGGPVRFSIAEINLMLTCVLMVFSGRTPRFGPVTIPVALYVGVSLLSSVFHWRPSALTSVVQIALYLVVAVAVFATYGRNEEDYRPALYGLLATGLILAVAVLIVRSGFVLMLHKNGVGSSLSVAVIVCGELWFAATSRKQRRWLSLVMVVLSAGLFFSLSRGAWMGAVVGLSLILILRGQIQLLFRFVLFLIPLVAICWNFLPAQSKNYTTSLGKESWNIKLRYESLDFARDLFEQEPIIGVGVGLRKEYDATNVFWLTLAETGILGCVTFLSIHVAVLVMVCQTRKKLKKNTLLYSMVVLAGALVTGKLLHGMVDHYWSRGSIMVVWSSVGMATYAYFVARRMRTQSRQLPAKTVPLPAPALTPAA